MSDILFAAADGVATITLNRPDVLNSFTRSMARELRDALGRVAADDTLRAVRAHRRRPRVLRRPGSRRGDAEGR